METTPYFLIVEDSPTQARKLQFILEEAGYEVEHAVNGVRALESLGRRLPTAVVSDVMMPEMDGFELCVRVRGNPAWQDIPFILLTSLSEFSDIVRGLESGADNFITKPYEKDYLLARIDYILNNLRLRELGAQAGPDVGIEIYFHGKKHYISSQKMQILDLLFSTFDAVLQKNLELERMNRELREAQENIKILHGLIPICANCKKIRNDEGFWEQVEVYIREHSDAVFSHGICPECLKQLYPELAPRILSGQAYQGKKWDE